MKSTLLDEILKAMAPKKATATALQAARRKLAAAVKKKAVPQIVQAIPMTPGAQRVDNSPYRKESSQ